MRAGEQGRSQVRVYPDAESAARAAAAELGERARASVAARGRFTLALSGGATPRLMYRALRHAEAGPGGSGIPWAATHVFWGDERTVPPDDPDSNFGLARRELLAHVPVPSAQLHRIRGEEDPARAAEAYEQTLRASFRLAAGDVPRFDLILLGLGGDAHTASLFPGTAAVAETERLVVASWVAALRTYRLTLTPIVLNRARAVLFLVVGGDKAAALRTVLEPPVDPARYPAQIVQPVDGDLIWIVDRGAARETSETGHDDDARRR